MTTKNPLSPMGLRRQNQKVATPVSNSIKEAVRMETYVSSLMFAQYAKNPTMGRTSVTKRKQNMIRLELDLFI